MKPMIIAVDGYSSCGKSTLAKSLAKRLNFAYIDTGAMYRAVTLYFIENNINWESISEDELEKQLDQIHIHFQYNPTIDASETYLNDKNVEDIIRGKEVSDAVSEVSQLKLIRKRMIGLQRKAGKNKQLVMDGRDIGSKVFPNAELKLFMTASPEIRAQRRYDELKTKGNALSLEEVMENLKQRDYNDTHRKENPLVQADDAVVLDNSHLDQDEQLEWVLKLIEVMND